MAARRGKTARREMNRDIHCVAAHPAAPEMLFTATPAGPIAATMAGKTGSICCQCRSPSYSAQIAVHPARPGTVLVGISRGFRGGDAALFHSTDRGDTWTRVTEQRPSLADTIFKALAFSSSTPEVAAAGTMAGEVWLTEDGGSTWSLAAVGSAPGAIAAGGVRRRENGRRRAQGRTARRWPWALRRRVVRTSSPTTGCSNRKRSSR